MLWRTLGLVTGNTERCDGLTGASVLTASILQRMYVYCVQQGTRGDRRGTLVVFFSFFSWRSSGAIRASPGSAGATGMDRHHGKRKNRVGGKDTRTDTKDTKRRRDDVTCPYFVPILSVLNPCLFLFFLVLFTSVFLLLFSSCHYFLFTFASFLGLSTGERATRAGHLDEK